MSKPRFVAAGAKRGRQTVTKMKPMRQNEQCWEALDRNGSRFEQPDLWQGCKTAVQAQFGLRLQKLYPLPAEDTEPENVRALRLRIQSKLDSLAVTPAFPEGGEPRPGLFESSRLTPQQA
ncbi:MAG TPA: hypothetical protein VFG05_01520 [Methylocella sp.]|nr:hypothetical protein [Methylocella sp.]